MNKSSWQLYIMEVQKLIEGLGLVQISRFDSIFTDGHEVEENGVYLHEWVGE